jgi:hypothetical protein
VQSSPTSAKNLLNSHRLRRVTDLGSSQGEDESCLDRNNSSPEGSSCPLGRRTISSIPNGSTLADLIFN